jgi:hypothetical protein
MKISTRGRFVTELAVAALIAAVTAAGYLGWLGWDQNKDVQPDGHVSGPYQPWQVIGLALMLGAIAVAAGLREHPVAAVLSITITMTVCFSITGATEADGDGLWPVGAVLVAIGTFFGIAFVAGLAYAFRVLAQPDRLVRPTGTDKP